MTYFEIRIWSSGSDCTRRAKSSIFFISIQELRTDFSNWTHNLLLPGHNANYCTTVPPQKSLRGQKNWNYTEIHTRSLVGADHVIHDLSTSFHPLDGALKPTRGSGFLVEFGPVFSAALGQLLIGLDGVYSSLHLMKPRPRVGASPSIDPFSVSVTSDLARTALPVRWALYSPLRLSHFMLPPLPDNNIFQSWCICVVCEAFESITHFVPQHSARKTWEAITGSRRLLISLELCIFQMRHITYRKTSVILSRYHHSQWCRAEGAADSRLGRSFLLYSAPCTIWRLFLLSSHRNTLIYIWSN